MFRLQHQQTRTLFMMAASSRIKPMPSKTHWIKLATLTKPVVRSNTWRPLQRCFNSNLQQTSTPSSSSSSSSSSSPPPPPPQKDDKDKKSFKEELKEDIYTIPNLLTFGRLVAAPCVGYMILQQNYDGALVLFALAGFTDLLDGHIARKYNMKTLLGTIIDPLADKVLMTVMTVTLAMEGTLPVPLAAVILGRDAGLVLSAFYYRYISLPEPKTIARYFDGTIPSAEVKPTQISKINTALQLFLMGFSLTTVSIGMPSSEAMTALQWVVGGTTVWSGASYIFSKDAVRILK